MLHHREDQRARVNSESRQLFRPLWLLILERAEAGRWLAPAMAVNRSQ
jgi:hypothetical protein